MVRWITSHSEYVDFYNPDFQFRTAYFYVPVLYSKGETAVGITIGRKIGNAVKRNLLKRRIKSWLYYNKEKLPIGFRFNLVARIGAADLQWLELSQELLKVITQINTKAVY